MEEGNERRKWKKERKMEGEWKDNGKVERGKGLLQLKNR